MASLNRAVCWAVVVMGCLCFCTPAQYATDSVVTSVPVTANSTSGGTAQDITLNTITTYPVFGPPRLNSSKITNTLQTQETSLSTSSSDTRPTITETEFPSASPYDSNVPYTSRTWLTASPNGGISSSSIPDGSTTQRLPPTDSSLSTTDSLSTLETSTSLASVSNAASSQKPTITDSTGPVTSSISSFKPGSTISDSASSTDLEPHKGTSEVLTLASGTTPSSSAMALSSGPTTLANGSTTSSSAIVSSSTTTTTTMADATTPSSSAMVLSSGITTVGNGSTTSSSAMGLSSTTTAMAGGSTPSSSAMGLSSQVSSLTGGTTAGSSETVASSEATTQGSGITPSSPTMALSSGLTTITNGSTTSSLTIISSSTTTTMAGASTPTSSAMGLSSEVTSVASGETTGSPETIPSSEITTRSSESTPSSPATVLSSEKPTITGGTFPTSSPTVLSSGVTSLGSSLPATLNSTSPLGTVPFPWSNSSVTHSGLESLLTGNPVTTSQDVPGETVESSSFTLFPTTGVMNTTRASWTSSTTQQATPLPAPTSGSGTTLPGLSGGTSTATTSTEPWITQAPEASTSSGQIPLINGTSQVTGNFTALPGDPQSIVNSSLMSTSMSTVTSVLADGSTTTEVIPVPVPVPTGKGGGGGGSGEGSGGCSDPGCANGGGGSSGSGGGGNGGTGAGSGSGGGGGTSGGGGGGTGAGSGGEGGSGTSGGGGGGEGKGSGGSGSGGEGEGEGDPDDNKPSETASPTSSATSSSSESCTSTVTATYKSVFCTVTTSSTTITTGTAEATAPVARRDKDCSTLAYSTIMKCSATATTATSSITATATAYANILCSGDTCGGGDCSLQDNPNDGGLVEVRDGKPVMRPKKKSPYKPKKAPKRTSEPAVGKWATPANYNNDFFNFMRGEVARAYKAGTIVGGTPDIAGAYFMKWANEPTQIAVQGVFGCTVIVVASRRGALVYHIWEDPVFGRWDKQHRKIDPPNEADVSKAIRQLWLKDDSAPDQIAGILDLRSDHPSYATDSKMDRAYHDILNNDAFPQVWIIAPVVGYASPIQTAKYQELRWDEAIRQRFVPEIERIFAEGDKPYIANPTIVKYSSQDWRDDNRVDFEYKVANGKTLLQYQPAEDCAGTAAYKLWVEAAEFGSDAWSPPYPGQYVYAGQHGTSKRDAGEGQRSCGLPCGADGCGGGAGEGAGDSCDAPNNSLAGVSLKVNVSMKAWVNFNPQSAPRRTSEPAEGKWAEPANYRNQDWAIFMRGEVAQCHSAETAVKLDPRGTASYAIRWEGNVDSMALEGLKGCAAVIVASRRGAVMFHLWESPVFTRVNPETRQVEPRQEEDWTNYVTHGLRYWDTQPPLVSMAGILNLRTDSDQYQENYNLEDMEDMLNNDANPQVYVVNTIEAQLVTDDNIIYAQQEKYPELVGRLIEEIQVMFAGGNAYPGGIPVLGLKYIVPAQGWDVNYATARGKVLLQYQPAADCQGQASWRLWHDGRWIHSDSWSSLGPHQIYTPYNALEARGQCPFKTVSGSNKTSTVFTNSSTTAPTSWTSSAANSSFTPTWGPAFNTSSVANATLGQTITSLMTTTGLPWMNITVGPTISPTPQAGNSSSSSNLLHRITDVSTLTANISSLTSTAALWSNTSSTSMPVLNSTSMPVLNSTSSTLMPTPTSTSTSSSSTTSSTPITSVATITWSWTVNSTTTVTSTASQAPKYARGTCRAHVKQSVAIQIDHDKKTFFATGFQVEVDIFDNAGNKITSGSSSSSSFTPSMEHPTEWFAWEQDVVIPRGKLDYEVILTMMPHAITVTYLAGSKEARPIRHDPGVPALKARAHVHDIPQDTKGMVNDIGFRAGSYGWSTKNNRVSSTDGYCNVGGWASWDIWNQYPVRNMDCYWPC